METQSDKEREQMDDSDMVFNLLPKPQRDVGSSSGEEAESSDTDLETLSEASKSSSLRRKRRCVGARQRRTRRLR